MKRKAILIALSLICTLCVFSFAGCFGGEDPHEHTYSDEWTYDETYHWHESTCVHLNETLDKARHDFDEGVETAPTFEHGGYITYTCYDCEYELIIETEDALSHNYSNVWSYDSYNHWHACLDQGYENLKGDLTAHTDTNEIIIRGATDNQAGLAQYTCSECLNTYQKPVYVSTEILTLPTVANQKVYIGQTLSALTLTGGSASVDGVFSWSNPSEKIIWSGNYEVTFTPTDTSVFAPTTCQVYVNAEFLTVNVSVGANGSANYNGIVSVEWGANLTITITPNLGYQVDSLMVDGVGVASATAYTFKNITTNHTITATFRELEVLPFTLTCISGTSGCYTYSGSTLTITEISAATVYAISGEFDGNIVIDVGDTYKFDLELHGFTLNCNYINPITILSGDEVAIQAKAGYQNYIYDNRAKIDETDTTLYSGAIHSMVDLEISGKGTLTVVSQNNNGIHGKDDLQVKNLTLSVSCIDNALKGNDGVEILNANTTLIARQGDCIKSVNSHINSTTLKQKGTISISGGTHNLYAACDGIDSSYDVVIDDATTVLNIYTDKYSEYSEEVTVVSESTYYLSATTTNYKYSVKYYNSNTGDTLWVDASTSYETVTSSSNRPGGSSSSTYYYTFAKKSGYTSLAVYLYSSIQTQGQDTNYVACSEYKTISESYDTVKVTYSSSKVSLSWTNYTTSSSSGGMGGMQEGNTDKGTYSTKGIKASNQITINNGTITIEAYDDAIH
ncbi:MAG: carbohydrate-binding domain-containing protein, partial [Clostridia bacterium]|nr:carbohydrate-binding domain-containing protein [Clostridia bacterium]